MAGKGNPVPGPHLNGFPMPTYSYFFPHMLGSLSPPALPGLPISGYSTPSPATLASWVFTSHYLKIIRLGYAPEQISRRY
ncbi:Retinoic acid receptor alpha [Collichthys lucidus]|uniref:Retinoic acid receptor alpha n=1 Tax=Collichthys lucidus TaxID=240159 RepID=A0A4U5VN58_COLLU|nr:Retinoic acid receptor alpha [Collichthys lucidus]